ncbi:alpha/beta hydrolase [Acinetobacter bohemicus]|uniref:alpha/beta fold hydrolase n=1 Tax=Acinetobacter sp. S4397-1 TaxID=2972915 RepID=UPI00209A9979|nr:alpha/beta hydrolase [Acinetobacter sp. S4397-1]MCO8045675.1 alpha/beta hydrolase [Acinetobacter sp. S4397-1]
MPFYTMPDAEQLFVREYGQGQPVLVLSGLGMLSWQWAAFLYPHRKNFRFIIPEWRGFGASGNCKIPSDLDAISSHWQDVRSVLAQLNLDKLMVIAYSMGATTAMHGLHYDHFAQHISAYLHIDQSPKISVDDAWAFGLFGSRHQEFIGILQEISLLLAQHVHLGSIRKLESSVRAALAALWLRFIQLQNEHKLSLKSCEFILNQPRLQGLLLPTQRIDYMLWYINNYLYHREDYRAALSQLSCPVTFFSGVQSRLYPFEGQRLIAESLPQAKQVLFNKSGHAPLLTEPVKFAKELSRFLKEHYPAPSTVNSFGTAI